MTITAVDSGGNAITIDTPTHPGAPEATDSYEVTNLSVDTEYTFTLTAVDTSNNSVAVAHTVSTLPDADRDGVADAVDVDDDNDGLIEIRNLDMLANVHNNLAGTSYDDTDDRATPDTGTDDFYDCDDETPTSKGSFCGAPKTLTGTACPSGSTDVDPHATNTAYLCGYELASNLDFADDDSYATDSTNKVAWRPNNSNPDNATNAGFPGIASADGTGSFSAIFEGNGLYIRHLYMRSNAAYVGFFRRNTKNIKNLGLLKANVYSTNSTIVGALVGSNTESGKIVACYSTGTVSSTGGSGATTGGLVGANNGTIIASYSMNTVKSDGGHFDNVGGLVGYHALGAIIASYATGSVNGGGGDNEYVGGLVGRKTALSTIDS